MYDQVKPDPTHMEGELLPSELTYLNCRYFKQNKLACKDPQWLQIMHRRDGSIKLIIHLSKRADNILPLIKSALFRCLKSQKKKQTRRRREGSVSLINMSYST